MLILYLSLYYLWEVSNSFLLPFPCLSARISELPPCLNTIPWRLSLSFLPYPDLVFIWLGLIPEDTHISLDDSFQRIASASIQPSGMFVKLINNITFKLTNWLSPDFTFFFYFKSHWIHTWFIQSVHILKTFLKVLRWKKYKTALCRWK